MITDAGFAEVLAFGGVVGLAAGLIAGMVERIIHRKEMKHTHVVEFGADSRRAPVENAPQVRD